MSRASIVRALLALTVLVLSAIAVLTTSPRLGLDLRGGTQIVLETRDGNGVTADAATTDRALEVLRRRVDALGVAEPTLARSGERRILIELPGVQNAAEAAAVVGRTAQLTFHPVTGAPTEPAPEVTGPIDSTRPQVLTDEYGQPLAIGPASLTGAAVGGASLRIEQDGSRSVAIDFRGEGGRSWAQLTAQAACSPVGAPQRRAAIVLDAQVISSPQVSPEVACDVGIVGGTTTITGDFTVAEGQELAALISGGALPVPVEIIQQSTVGPTLGRDAIDASGQAAVIGLALTAVFLAIVYRLVGVLAAVALATYGLISYAALITLGATLTLPGLAGLLLSAGLAIDANVLVFERAREEYAQKQRLQGALRTAYGKALSAIADSAVTTLLAAGLLFVLATGPVRGFGVTLVIGTLASLFSALVVCRAFTDVAATRGWVVGRPAVSGLASLGRVRTWLTRRDPDLMRRPRAWLAASGVALVLAGAGILTQGLNLGVEFTGGRLAEFSTTRQVDVDRAREAVADAGFPTAVVQRAGQDDVSVRTGRITDAEQERVRTVLAELGGGAERIRDETVGPTLGAELRDKALIALGVALAAQLLYLAARFRWTFAAAAVLAMLQDVVLVVGAFAWLGKPIDAVFLAAALTIIGVSVNDSIVTLDRIRERWGQRRTDPLPSVVNTAILQTAPRTVNTGIGAMFMLAALVLLGGSSLTDFALALLLGLVVGTYSSAFTAAPLVLLLERRRNAPPPMPKAARSPVRPGSPRDSGAVV
ncbi:MAG TPA: protein translocase subunit SecD [Actinomycetales bacterium]|jgi:SecD/SecF fusion protein